MMRIGSRLGSMTLLPLLLVLLVLLVLSSGCSHEVVPSSGPRAPTSPDQVKIYPKYPQKYEDLGLVTLPITADMQLDQSGNSVPTIDGLKAKAAALGANGMLLKLDQESYDMGVLVGYHRQHYEIPMRREPRTALAEAIYVIKE